MITVMEMNSKKSDKCKEMTGSRTLSGSTTKSEISLGWKGGKPASYRFFAFLLFTKRWRLCFPSECRRTFTKLHVVTTQKIVLYKHYLMRVYNERTKVAITWDMKHKWQRNEAHKVNPSGYFKVLKGTS
jgi:hypothetical protein